MKRILITGPVERLEEWCAAARAAGWDAIAFSLIEIVPRDLPPEDAFDGATRFDWLCLTSRNALPFVERALAAAPQLATRAAAVGEPTLARLAELGLETPLEAAHDAAELGARVAAATQRGASVLWPRGDRSDELARILRAAGLSVTDPIVYTARGRDAGAPPAAEAVFFASASAVQAWCEQPELPEPPLAIAIGASTFDALVGGTGSCATEIVALAAPTPDALQHVLGHLP